MGKALKFIPGTDVSHNGIHCRVRKAVNATEILIEDVATRERRRVKVAELVAWSAGEDNEAEERWIESLTDEELATAQYRRETISPLDSVTSNRGQAFERVAKQSGVSVPTLRRWVRRFRRRNFLVDLAPKRRGRKMPTRLDPKVESIIADCIDDYYLSDQQPSKEDLYKEIGRRCKKRGLRKPGRNAIRKRLAEVPKRQQVRRRRGEKEARDQYGEIKGEFPGGNYRLEHVQVDHSKLDINVVSEVDRKLLGRPFLTLAVDVFSRMITGCLFSFDNPSAHSVGLCVANSVLPKEPELERLGIEGDWPVWGLMECLHTDNGKDFRSQSLARACKDYGIRLEWRPAKTPHYGGHVERVFGTIKNLVHTLPGTTFSNTKQRGTYPSEKKAVLTLTDLEKIIIDFIVNDYHVNLHKGIRTSPLKMWESSITGSDTVRAMGHPEKVEDEERLRISFLPSVERTVQKKGITWDNIWYYSEALRPWIKAKKGGKTAKFIVRRDPRDISKIFFWDPDGESYIVVPYRNMTRPTVNLWEFREAHAICKDDSDGETSEDRIFDVIERRRELVHSAIEITKTAKKKDRRNAEAKKHRGKPVAEKLSPPVKLVVDNDAAEEVSDDFEFQFSDEDLKPRFKERT